MMPTLSRRSLVAGTAALPLSLSTSCAARRRRSRRERFSDEPGLYLPGKAGVRRQDCFPMTEAGPRWLSEPPASIDAPV